MSIGCPLPMWSVTLPAGATNGNEWLEYYHNFVLKKSELLLTKVWQFHTCQTMNPLNYLYTCLPLAHVTNTESFNCPSNYMCEQTFDMVTILLFKYIHAKWEVKNNLGVTRWPDQARSVTCWPYSKMSVSYMVVEKIHVRIKLKTWDVSTTCCVTKLQ